MFPFDRPTNYGEMLNKISTFTFAIGILATFVVAAYSPPVRELLGSSHTQVDLWSFKIPLGYVIPSAIFTLVARVIRLHDRISDVFAIRESFDVNQILLPLSQQLGIHADAVLTSQLRSRRKAVMNRFFYRYASFEEPKISKALVLGAIDVWTWYWVLLEAICIILIAALVLSFVGRPLSAAITYLVLLGCVLLFLTYNRFCGKRAQDQIEEILSEQERADVIKDELLRMQRGGQIVA